MTGPKTSGQMTLTPFNNINPQFYAGPLPLQVMAPVPFQPPYIGRKRSISNINLYYYVQVNYNSQTIGGSYPVPQSAQSSMVFTFSLIKNGLTVYTSTQELTLETQALNNNPAAYENNTEFSINADLTNNIDLKNGDNLSALHSITGIDLVVTDAAGNQYYRTNFVLQLISGQLIYTEEDI